MSQQSMDDFVVRDGRLQPKSPSDIGSIDDVNAGMAPHGKDDALKKLKNALWTGVMRVEQSSIARARAASQYDDVANALTNVDIMGDDEHKDLRILFDTAAFEAPPEGSTLDDLRMPQGELAQALKDAASLRTGFAAVGKELEQD